MRSARVGLGGRASTKYSQPENVSNQCDQNNEENLGNPENQNEELRKISKTRSKEM